ncbi:hypothetical protein CPC08DRAFT_776665, partial [Agrocybe pediades]
MLFSSERIMEIPLWESIPETTNSEESMHWKLYSAVGEQHSLLEGLGGLHQFAVHFAHLHETALSGGRVRYGRPEPWKDLKDEIGRTKRSRASNGAKNKTKESDARPPDTAKELLGPKSKKKSAAKSAAPALKIAQVPTLGPPSYPWRSNSCWIDTSLELLYICLLPILPQLKLTFDKVPQDTPLHSFYSTIISRERLAATRNTTEATDSKISLSLSLHRDQLRETLFKAKMIDSVDEFSSLIGWLFSALRAQDHTNQSWPATSSFLMWMFDYHRCNGNLDGGHIEITEPRRVLALVLDRERHTKFKGSVKKWFEHLLRADKPSTQANQCWRVYDGECLCPGTRTDLNDLVLSIPIILTVEIKCY